MKLTKGLIKSDEDDNVIMSKDTFCEMDNNFYTVLKENRQLEEENYKLREENTHLGMLNCDLEMYLKEHKSRINKATARIKTIINIIKEQPTDNIHTDMYIIGALNSLLYILDEVEENE